MKDNKLKIEIKINKLSVRIIKNGKTYLFDGHLAKRIKQWVAKDSEVIQRFIQRL